MSIHDLPSNLHELSLDHDKELTADVVDLFCPVDARRDGALAILICDDGGRLVQPIIIDGPPVQMDQHEVRLMLEHTVGVAGAGSSTILAICRPGGMITDADRRWHGLVIDRCRALGIRLIGTYVATPEHVLRLPDPL